MRPYQICTRCVMDTSDPDIVFDANGVCNHCHSRDAWAAEQPSPHQRQRKLEETVVRVKQSGQGRQYDCLVGVSGGVDSSYVLHLAKELGLRPLAFHFDNGWNSETAVRNIHSLVNKLGVDMYTYVVDWPEFRDMQRAFFKASVIDIELLTDHAQKAINLRTAAKNHIKYVLTGNNRATEFPLPKSWRWNKWDSRNIRAIQRRFGTKPVKSYPAMSFVRTLRAQLPGGATPVAILNLIGYDKQAAKQLLMERYEWRDYGGKHWESVFTKFFQAHVLPTKFGVDKRRAHLSSLIWSGGVTRDEALAELEQPLYTPRELEEETAYVRKKLGMSETDFAAVMAESPVPHSAYANNQSAYDRFNRLTRRLYLLKQRLIGGKA